MIQFYKTTEPWQPREKIPLGLSNNNTTTTLCSAPHFTSETQVMATHILIQECRCMEWSGVIACLVYYVPWLNINLTTSTR